MNNLKYKLNINKNYLKLDLNHLSKNSLKFDYALLMLIWKLSNINNAEIRKLRN